MTECENRRVLLRCEHHWIGGKEGSIVLLSPCRPSVRFASDQRPRNDWQAKPDQPGGDNWTHAVRKYAVAQKQQQRCAVWLCSYWVKWTCGRVIPAAVHFTVHQSQNRLADKSRLDAILMELLPTGQASGSSLGNTASSAITNGLLWCRPVSSCEVRS